MSVLFAETDTFEWKSIWREATRNKAKRNRGAALNSYDYSNIEEIESIADEYLQAA